MNAKSRSIKDGIFVTIGSIVVLILSFALYFLLFRLFEGMIMGEQEGMVVGHQPDSLNFVSWLRMGYGIAWLLGGLPVYRSGLPEWFKASILAGALTSFFAAFGVQLYEMPMIMTGVIILVIAAALVWLYKMHKKWYHYYAVAIAIAASAFYLFPY